MLEPTNNTLGKNKMYLQYNLQIQTAEKTPASAVGVQRRRRVWRKRVGEISMELGMRLGRPRVLL